MTELVLPEGIEPIDAPLPGVKVDTPVASGVIYFNGAHVAEWTPAGERPVLWLSDHAVFKTGTAIRGGVPVLWPWFGAGASGVQSPAHGFARLACWNLLHAKVSPSGTASIALGLDGGMVAAELAPGLPRDYRLELHISMGRTLMLQLVVLAGDTELVFEEGLHTYLAVGDISKVRVECLDGAAYSDRLSGQTATQQGALVFSSETDRVYESREALRVVDDELGRTLLIEKVGSAQTVVWNPWDAKAAALTDMGDDEWRQLLCVEAVNTREQAVRVQPRSRHLISQTISLI